ncbi:MAG: PilZ domain-containing protein [Elusimicrobiales bacterium]|jgi:hypothetical protein|nr:PilZ domain-containing protein [Elusimicrobiales bacterium]
MTKKNKVIKERRAHVRLPMLNGILEPVEIEFFAEEADGKTVPQPAILADLSAGGMRLITFALPPKSKELNIVLQLAGMKNGFPVTGRIAWVKEKSGVYMTGIAFTQISDHDKKVINEMAEDFADCDTRFQLKLPDVCSETCKASGLCNKPQKDDSLFKK